MMRRKINHRQQSGQALILIALMLLVLTAGVGLSVDVGNAYGRQRTDQAAANAAALAGMNAFLQDGTDGSVENAVVSALQANRVVNYTRLSTPSNLPGAGELIVFAEYLAEDYSSLGYIGSGVAPTANRLKYVRVRIVDDVDTYFAKIVGRDTLRVSAEGIATTCKVVNGVYPLTFDYSHLLTGRGADVNDTSDDQLVSRGNEIWVPLGSDHGNLGWVSWTGSNAAGDLANAWGGAGTLSQGFVEMYVGRDGTMNPQTMSGTNLPRGDSKAQTYPVPGTWLYTDPGWSVKSDLKTNIFDKVDGEIELILPVHSLYNPDYNGVQGGGPFPEKAKSKTNNEVSWTHGVWGDGTDVVNLQEKPGNGTGYRLLNFYRFNMIGITAPSVCHAIDDLAFDRCQSKTIYCAGDDRSGDGVCLRYLGPIDMEEGRACAVSN